MRDTDIRPLLKQRLLKSNISEPTARIVDEMEVCLGNSRIDVAVINGHFRGYEIKSNCDTLYRLSSQIDDYIRVFNYLTFVVGNKHTAHLERAVPEWCGIIEASYNEAEELILRNIRSSKINKQTDPTAIAQLLWKDECVILLKRKGAKCLSNKSRVMLRKMVPMFYKPNELNTAVRAILKERADWKSENILSQCGDC